MRFHLSRSDEGLIRTSTKEPERRQRLRTGAVTYMTAILDIVIVMYCTTEDSGDLMLTINHRRQNAPQYGWNVRRVGHPVAPTREVFWYPARRSKVMNKLQVVHMRGVHTKPLQRLLRCI